MKKWEKLVGNKYGSLTLLGVRKQGNKYPGVFKCECGTEALTDIYKVRNGFVRSCGCKMLENIATSKVKHGHSKRAGGNETPEYASWRAMKERCTNPANKSYKNYGQRGVGVSKRWLLFANFFEDMGEKPEKGYTLERIDNERGYSKNNCVWASRQEQAYNKRLPSNKTGLPGIRYTPGKKADRWTAQIVTNGKHTHLGTYDNPRDASDAYLRAAEGRTKITPIPNITLFSSRSVLT